MAIESLKPAMTVSRISRAMDVPRNLSLHLWNCATDTPCLLHSSAMFVAVNDSMTICYFCSTVNFSGMCISCSMGME